MGDEGAASGVCVELWGGEGGGGRGGGNGKGVTYLSVDNMTCVKCVGRVERVLKALPGDLI